MLHLSSSCRYYLYRDATDMRKGFDSLCGIVTSQLKMDVLNGSVFIFINKKHNQVKLLLWEGDGFSVYFLLKNRRLGRWLCTDGYALILLDE